MLSNGFADLAEGNPELAYRVIVDILSGINEWVTALIFSNLFPYLTASMSCHCFGHFFTVTITFDDIYPLRLISILEAVFARPSNWQIVVSSS